MVTACCSCSGGSGASASGRRRGGCSIVTRRSGRTVECKHTTLCRAGRRWGYACSSQFFKISCVQTTADVTLRFSLSPCRCGGRPTSRASCGSSSSGARRACATGSQSRPNKNGDCLSDHGCCTGLLSVTHTTQQSAKSAGASSGRLRSRQLHRHEPVAATAAAAALAAPEAADAAAAAAELPVPPEPPPDAAAAAAADDFP